MRGCRAGSANCGEKAGPDFDIGTPAMLVTFPDGRDVIIVGQKSGMTFAIDPDKEGAILWQYRAGEGSIWGGVQWEPAKTPADLIASIQRNKLLDDKRYFW